MLMMMMRVPWRHLVQICRCFRPKDFAGPPATVATGNWQLATSNWQPATPTVASGNININIKIRHSLWLPSHFHSMPKRKAPHNFRAAFPRLGKWICGER